MKIILINTSFKDIYGYEKMFPLGLGYLAAVLKKDGHNVSLLEPQLDDIGDCQLREHLRKENPDLIGLTAVTPTFPQALELARIIKEELSAVPIVLGGVHASSFPDKLLDAYKEFDFIIFGEGEVTFSDLCRRLAQGGENFHDIPGLCFRGAQGVVKNISRELITQLDAIPFPDRDLVNLSRYKLPLHIEKGKRSVSMITSRGCPAGCIFCSSKVTMGPNFRAHSCDYVIKEIEHLVRHHKVDHIQFVDDTFTISPERVRMICRQILKRNIRIEWHCFARVETVSEELLFLMKAAGCTSILFGIESGDEQILKNIKKGISMAKAKQAHQAARKAGITVLSSFILGNPGETLKTAKSTIDFACKLNPSFALFYRLVPYPGSPAYQMYSSQGRLKMTLGWESFAPKGKDMVFEHENLSSKQLGQLIITAYRRFYFRPAQVARVIRAIRTPGQVRAIIRGVYSLTKQMFRWNN